MECPRCPSNELKLEVYEGVEIDRCPNCSGAWLDFGEVSKIIEERQMIFKKDYKLDVVSDSFKGVPQEAQESRIPCPKCMSMMNTYNYGADSGVILDKCKKNHGFWFDKDELEKTQAFREHWQDEAVKRGPEWKKLAGSIVKDNEPYDGAVSPLKLLVNLFYD
ncbi:zf-TFIIB domain-containing protein [Bacteriovoracaceae bacterium]|nr:zf-TFIIB domain-containing protein [Bacteriovoracaceae bacterium]